MYGKSPNPPTSRRTSIFSESEDLKFGLVEYVRWSGSVVVAAAEPSLFLIFTEQLKKPGVRRTFSTGDATRLQSSQRLDLEPDMKLWQITGSSKLLGDLEHFAARLHRKDAEVAAHSARVAQLATAVGQQLGFSVSRLGYLGLAAYLHDVGKLKLSTHILQTPASLTPDEWQRVHPKNRYSCI